MTLARGCFSKTPSVVVVACRVVLWTSAASIAVLLVGAAYVCSACLFRGIVTVAVQPEYLILWPLRVCLMVPCYMSFAANRLLWGVVDEMFATAGGVGTTLATWLCLDDWWYTDEGEEAAGVFLEPLLMPLPNRSMSAGSPSSSRPPSRRPRSAAHFAFTLFSGGVLGTLSWKQYGEVWLGVA